MRGLFCGLVIVATSCGDDPVEGACNVQRFPVPGTSYSETSNYCASQAQCASYCSVVDRRSDAGHCGYDPTDTSCSDGALPPPPAPEEFCAVYRSITCGGSDDYRPHCDGYSCDLAPNSSDYDPSTGCTIGVGGDVGIGASCAEAIADLTGSDDAACPATPDDTSCDRCMKGSCCDEINECRDTPACVELATCVSGCGANEHCVQTCATDHGGGVAGLNAYLECLDAQCTTTCQ